MEDKCDGSSVQPEEDQSNGSLSRTLLFPGLTAISGNSRSW
jgi:hypothetical protein